MEPRIALNRDIDPLDHSPLVRGIVLAMSYADAEGGIGLKKSGAINRRFVHWAAERFVWPGYTSEDLVIVNKVLNERDMPPLWPVQNVLLHLKLMRRYKGTLRTTKRGRALGAIPRQLFDVVAPVYLYRYVHYDLAQNRGGSHRQLARLCQRHQYRSSYRLHDPEADEGAVQVASGSPIRGRVSGIRALR